MRIASLHAKVTSCYLQELARNDCCPLRWGPPSLHHRGDSTPSLAESQSPGKMMPDASRKWGKMMENWLPLGKTWQKWLGANRSCADFGCSFHSFCISQGRHPLKLQHPYTTQLKSPYFVRIEMSNMETHGVSAKKFNSPAAPLLVLRSSWAAITDWRSRKEGDTNQLHPDL